MHHIQKRLTSYRAAPKLPGNKLLRGKQQTHPRGWFVAFPSFFDRTCNVQIEVIHYVRLPISCSMTAKQRRFLQIWLMKFYFSLRPIWHSSYANSDRPQNRVQRSKEILLIPVIYTIEEIDHSKIKAQCSQINGICERVQRTMQDELYVVAFQKGLSIYQ